MSELRECGESCSHYDSLNLCCWQATEKGLCFHVCEGDYCHLGYVGEGDYEESEIDDFDLEEPIPEEVLRSQKLAVASKKEGQKKKLAVASKKEGQKKLGEQK